MFTASPSRNKKCWNCTHTAAHDSCNMRNIAGVRVRIREKKKKPWKTTANDITTDTMPEKIYIYIICKRIQFYFIFRLFFRHRRKYTLIPRVSSEILNLVSNSHVILPYFRQCRNHLMIFLFAHMHKNGYEYQADDVGYYEFIETK